MTYETYESLTYWKKKFQPLGEKKKKISTLHVQKKNKKTFIYLNPYPPPPDDFSNGPSPSRMLVLYKCQGTAIHIA